MVSRESRNSLSTNQKPVGSSNYGHVPLENSHDLGSSGLSSRVPRLRVPAFATEGVATAAIEAQQTAPRDITMTKNPWEPKLPKTNRSCYRNKREKT